MKFELYRRLTLRGFKWFFRGRSTRNGQILFQSQSYSRKIDAIVTCNSIKDQATAAHILELK